MSPSPWKQSTGHTATQSVKRQALQLSVTTNVIERPLYRHGRAGSTGFRPVPQTPEPALASPRRMSRAKKAAQKVELVPAGIRVGEETVPLLAGTAHYWR